jgi:hypothetical protein
MVADTFGKVSTKSFPPGRRWPITLNIRGNSYRLKDKLKAGVVRPAEASE